MTTTKTKKDKSGKSNTGSLLSSKLSKGMTKGSELSAIGLGLSGVKPKGSTSAQVKAADEDGAFLVSVDLVSENPHNPRKKRPQAEIDKLRVSIETNSQGAPVVVRQDPKDPTRYIVEKGSGRVRAISESSVVNDVWCVFRRAPLVHDESISKIIDKVNRELGLEDYDPFIELEAVTENVSRDDMDVIDIGESALRLAAYGVDNKTYAENVGMEPREVSEMVTLVKADNVIRNLYVDGKATFSACLYLARAFKKDPEFILDAIRNAEESKSTMSVSWAEGLKKMVSTGGQEDGAITEPENSDSLEKKDASTSEDPTPEKGSDDSVDGNDIVSEETDSEHIDKESPDTSSSAEDFESTDDQNEEPVLPPSNGIVKRSRSKANISVKVGDSSGTLAIDYAASEPDMIVVEFSNGELKTVAIGECIIVGYE